MVEAEVEEVEGMENNQTFKGDQEIGGKLFLDAQAKFRNKLLSVYI